MSISIKPATTDPVFRDRLVIRTPGQETNNDSSGKLILSIAAIAALGAGAYFAWPYLQQSLPTSSPTPAVEPVSSAPANTATPISKPTPAIPQTGFIRPDDAPPLPEPKPTVAQENSAVPNLSTKPDSPSVTVLAELEQPNLDATTLENSEPEPTETTAPANETPSATAAATTEPSTANNASETPKATPNAVADPSLPPAAPPTAAEHQVEQLLAQGERQLADFQLSRPEGDNAYDTFVALAQLDGNQAEQFFQKILVQYLEFARKQIQDQNILSAVSSLEKMRELDPQHQTIAVLEEEILQAWQQAVTDGLKAGRMNDGQGSPVNIVRAMQGFAAEHSITKATTKQILKKLGQMADEHLQKKRYTTPKNNNAYEVFQLMDQLEPDNPRAQKGFNALASQYVRIAKASLNSGRLEAALGSVNRGLNIQPRHAELLDLRKQIAQKRQTPNYNLLQRARLQLRSNQLTQPPGNNAYESYQKILLEDPSNEEALQGIQKVASRYEQLARKHWGQGEFQKSLALINEGLAVSPQHSGLNGLKQEILQQWQ